MEQEPQLIHYLILAGLGIALMASAGWTLFRYSPQPRKNVPWNGWILLGLFVAYLFLQVVSVQVFVQGYRVVTGEKISRESLRQMFDAEGDPTGPEFAHRLNQMNLILLSTNAGSVLCLLLGILFLRKVGGATARDLGWNWSEILTDVRLGVCGFLLAAPPILTVQAILRTVQKDSVREHVIEKMMRSAETLPRADLALTMLVLACSASVVAPIVEEFLFRVVLQGWFEARLPRFLGQQSVTAVVDPPADAAPPGSAATPDVAELAADVTVNPYASPLPTDPTAAPVAAEPAPITPNWGAGWVLSILSTSLLFAAAHFTQWPDPVPLFLFALMLGYLYQTTHRILPSIVAHFCLNTFSLTMMWLAFVVRPGG